MRIEISERALRGSGGKLKICEWRIKPFLGVVERWGKRAPGVALRKRPLGVATQKGDRDCNKRSITR